MSQKIELTHGGKVYEVRMSDMTLKPDPKPRSLNVLRHGDFAFIASGGSNDISGMPLIGILGGMSAGPGEPNSYTREIKIRNAEVPRSAVFMSVSSGECKFLYGLLQNRMRSIGML